MDLKLSEKVVLITGGTSGIGEAIVFGFAGEGAIPVYVGRDAKKAEIIEDKLRAMGVLSHFIQADLNDAAICEKIVAETINKFGKIDVVVNNAGINDGISLDGSIEDFENSIKKNLVHYFAMIKYARPYLEASKGAIVNIGSKVANTGQGGTSGYAASKGGIQALTREWAADFRNKGVRVNEVIPAETWTPLYEKWVNTFDDPKAKLDSITKNIPFGNRITTSEEIADTVVFIASKRASHITGQHLYVDGGYTHLDRSLTA